MGVSIIEGGFPSSSREEFETVRTIAGLGLDATICGLSRSLKNDVDACIDAGVGMVHVFIPTSEVQRENTIKKTHEEVLDITAEIIGYARSHIDQVLFSAMDATRTKPIELVEVFRTAVDAGATAINVPDTVGVATPSSMRALIEMLRQEINCTIDVHCHNDFGMAVANTVTAVEAGANQVQVTVNGIGERAGNADIAGTVMAIESILKMNTGIKTQKLVETSKMVSRFSGISVPPTQQVVGENAFSHESGIHSHGVIANSSTFEPGIMTPEMVGHRRRLKLGKHVGKHAVREMLTLVHIEPNDRQLDEIIKKIKQISAKGKKVMENDLYEIAASITGTEFTAEVILLKDIGIMTGNHIIPTATVRAIVNGEEKVCSRTGDGPVDAALRAIMGIAPTDVNLKDFSISAISGGTDAIGHVTITVEDEKGRLYDAGASGEDIIIASAEAMTNSINMVYRYGSNNS